MTTSLHDFRLVAISHLAAARSVLEALGNGEPARTPTTAAYLATVSLECLLKARILFRGGFESEEKLREKQPRIHGVLFKSASGHAIASLADHLRLAALLQAEGRNMPQGTAWARLCGPKRPYSLRYGNEHLSTQDASEEIVEVERLHAPLLAGLKLAAKGTSEPKRTRKR